jgi:choloylglycine hydrolase
MLKPITKLLSIPLAVVLTLTTVPAFACTTITLRGEDGTVVVGRTMEWAEFDLDPHLIIVPRGREMTVVDKMPDGKDGASWTAEYGFVGIDVLGTFGFTDAVNEKGLAAEALYLPGFADFQPYDPEKASTTIGPMDFVGWIVSQFATVDEAIGQLPFIRVAPITLDVLGMPAPLHFMVTDAAGDQVVIEYVGGELQMHDSLLGVMTNSPTYSWHITNLRNYLNLRATSLPDVKVGDMDLKPLGLGSGMIGLPGDFTPPSRFVRSAAFSQTARKTEGGYDSVRELFRILDNFNVPITAVDSGQLPEGIKPITLSGTQWTTGIDLKNLVLYYHTDTDRGVRKVDLKAIDFSTIGPEPIRQPLRKGEEDMIKDVTPRP